MVNSPDKKAAVTLHRRARVSPAKKQETPAKQRPPTATPVSMQAPPGQKGSCSQGGHGSLREAQADAVKRTAAGGGQGRCGRGRGARFPSECFTQNGGQEESGW